jgi:hypothetical protein
MVRLRQPGLPRMAVQASSAPYLFGFNDPHLVGHATLKDLNDQDKAKVARLIQKVGRTRLANTNAS